MHIEHLEYFLSLAETLNFTETAEQFYTTQSNISKQIMNLEKQLGTTLFTREHRSIQLSPAGKALLPHAITLLESYRDLKQTLLPYQNSQTMTLRINNIPAMNCYIKDLIANFHREFPNTLLHMEELESINLLKTVDNGQCDIAFMRIFELNTAKYEKITVEQDHFVAILPKDHPLAARSKIHLSELKEEHFYQLDNLTQLYQKFSLLCNQAQFEPKVAFKGTHIQNILDFVSNGMGVSLIMKNSFNHAQYPNIVYVQLDFTLQSELAFIRHKALSHSTVGEQFWNYAKKHI